MSATISAYRSVRLDKNKPRREGGALMPFACSTTSFLLTEHEGSQQRCQLDRLFWSNSDLGEFNDDQEHRTRHRDCTYKSDGSCNFQPSIGRVSSWRFGGSQSCCAGSSTKVKYRHHTVRHYQNYASGGHRPQDNDTYYGTVGQVNYPPSGYKLPW
jgi:hypothetical protein